MSFQIHALQAEQFQHYFNMPDDELKTHHALREKVTANPGTPCRISLQDAEIGEQVVLIHFEHQPENSPFKASHAIYVRHAVAQACPEIDHVPAQLNDRLISVHAFDAKHLMINADVVAGTDLASSIHQMLEEPKVSYLHLHYAKPGCYAARVTRV